MTRRKKFGISKALSESLSQTVQVVGDHAGNLRYEVVPVEMVELDPDNPREMKLEMDDLPLGPSEDDPLFKEKMKDKQSLQSLSNAVKQKGIINPVWLYKHGQKYRLVAGERRVLASIMAGKHDVPAKILDSKPKDIDLRLLQWMENIERTDLTLWERVQNLRMIVDAYQADRPEAKITPTFIKQLLGCSLPHASNYLAVLQSPDEILHAIEQGKVHNLEKTAFLAHQYESENFETLFLACLNGATLKQLQSLRSCKSHTDNSGKTSVGRPATKINLGSTKNPNLIKLLFQSIEAQMSDKLKLETHDIDWSDYKAVSKAFNKVLKQLEAIIES